MSIECTIRFTHDGADAVSERLRQLPFLRELTPGKFEMRADPAGDGAPCASLEVLPDGLLYRDDSASDGSLGRIVAHLGRHYGAITIDGI